MLHGKRSVGSEGKTLWAVFEPYDKNLTRQSEEDETDCACFSVGKKMGDVIGAWTSMNCVSETLRRYRDDP
jgi:hypothetical protein